MAIIQIVTPFLYIPNPRAHIWQTNCWHIYPPWRAVSQIPALTAHISFLLWELIFGRSGVGRYTPENSDLVLAHQMAISQIPALTVHISFSLLSAHIWQTRMGRFTPPPTSNSNYRFLLWELIFGRPSVGRSTPLEWQFHWFLLWQLIFQFYSESSYLADQLWTDLSPHQMVISQIAALTPHISFLLWGLIFCRPGVGRSTPCIK